MKCIIIDDEQLSREILSIMILKTLGLTVVKEFSNGKEAINYLKSGKKVDLIFLDIHMPNFSGIDFIKTIKNPPAVILVTTDKKFALEAFNHDFVIDYLLKPIMEERFQSCFETMFDKYRYRILLKKNSV